MKTYLVERIRTENNRMNVLERQSIEAKNSYLALAGVVPCDTPIRNIVSPDWSNAILPNGEYWYAQPFDSCDVIAEQWENWCGETKWSILLRQFGDLGGKIISYGGRPRSSAVPLCFMLFLGADKLPGHSRLKDIAAAIEIAKARRRKIG